MINTNLQYTIMLIYNKYIIINTHRHCVNIDDEIPVDLPISKVCFDQ